MKRRSGKYLNAREYAERLWLSDNPDIQDFAREFLNALDTEEDSEFSQIKAILDEYRDDVAGKSYIEKVRFLDDASDTLEEIEDQIQKACPEYKDMEIDAIISDMLTRLRPKIEYDL